MLIRHCNCCEKEINKKGEERYSIEINKYDTEGFLFSTSFCIDLCTKCFDRILKDKVRLNG